MLKGESYEVIIGLEVHCQLLTSTKLFCACEIDFKAPANTLSCPICLGYPGTLPLMSEEAVEKAIALALCLDGNINPHSTFERKQYFYPDLPKGYQITQVKAPYCRGAKLKLAHASVDIERIHIEEDAGKLIHEKSLSYVDFNRAGSPLCEVVTTPTIKSVEEAIEFLIKLNQIVKFARISDGQMEEGSFRCDANISLRPIGQSTLGNKTELKNLNSFKHVGLALEYEIKRQTALLSEGNEVVQETRLFDHQSGQTRAMRSKEDSPDYRYFPDPDLSPLIITSELVDRIKKSLPKLPEERQEYYQKLGLTAYESEQILSYPSLSDYFEQGLTLLSDKISLKKWLNFLMGPFIKNFQANPIYIPQGLLEQSALVELLGLEERSQVQKREFDDLYKALKEGQITITELLSKRQLNREDGANSNVVEKSIDGILKQEEKAVESYRKGELKALGYLMGLVLKELGKSADPKQIKAVLELKLKNGL